MVKCPIPSCKSVLKDNEALYDHARKLHKNLKWNNFMAALVGGIACRCGTLVQSQRGLKMHQAKSQCSSQDQLSESDHDSNDQNDEEEYRPPRIHSNTTTSSTTTNNTPLINTSATSPTTSTIQLPNPNNKSNHSH